MKCLLKSLMTLGLLLMVSASAWAVFPNPNHSVCDSETVKTQFKDTETVLHKASTTLFYQSFAPHPNFTAVQDAMDQLQQSLDFLSSHYKPESKFSRPIPAMLLTELKNRMRNAKLEEPGSIEEGLQVLKTKIGNGDRHALDVASAYSLNSGTLFDEAVTTLGREAPTSSACHQERLKEQKARSDYLQYTPAGQWESFWTGLLAVLALAIFFGVIFTRQSGRGGWLICLPVCWALPYILTFPLNWIPFIGKGLSGLVGLGLIVYFSFLWHRKFAAATPNIHGSADWASMKASAQSGRIQPKGYVLCDSHGFALGRVPDAPKDHDPRLRYTGHVLTCAPTGAGKGIGAVIPNLLEYPGSALVLDIKGENYAVTRRTRQAMGHEVFVLDPFGVTEQGGHAFNWLDRLVPSDPDVVSESAMLADMIVIPDSHGDAYWDEAAKDLLRGLLVHVAGFDEERRNMGEVRRLLTGGESLLNFVLQEMANSDAGFGVVSRTAHSFLSKADKDRSGVLSSAVRHTAFLDDPRIIEALSRSDFNLADLKSKRMTVYVVLPPSKLAAYNRFMRCFVGLALAAITESGPKPEYNVVFFLDEFAQLGRMAAIEDAISLVRGYGASFWIFVQDLSQLKGVYPKWQTFLANTAKQFFGTADLDTANYISNTLGEYTTSYETSSRSIQDAKLSGGSHSTSVHLAGRKLMTADEIMRLSPQRPIVLISGERPYLLQRLNYLTDPEYQGMADENPFHARL